MPSRGLSVLVTPENTMESPKRTTVAPAAWRARSPVSMVIVAPPTMTETDVVSFILLYLSADKDRKALCQERWLTRGSD